MKQLLIIFSFLPCLLFGQGVRTDNVVGRGGIKIGGSVGVGGIGVSKKVSTFDYNSYSDSLFTVMTDLTTAEKRKIDSLFVRLDEYGTIDKLDVLNIQIVDSPKYSLLNWVSTNHYPVKSGSPIFTPNVGYRTTTNHYINTTFNPKLDGDNYTLHNASFGVWVFKDTVNTTGLDFGARKSTIPTTRTSLTVTSSDKKPNLTINNRSSSPSSLSKNKGLYSISMTNDSARGYHNGRYGSIQVAATPVLDSLDFYLGAYNLNDGTASNYSKRIYSGYFIGGGLRDWDMKIIYDAVADYAESKGVEIIHRSDSLNVVCDGNSLTKGTTNNDGKKYPQFLQDSLRSISRVDSVYNLGVDSQTSQDMDSADADVENKWSPYNKRNILIAWEITNSLYFGQSVQSAIDDLETYCLHQKRRGYEVAVVTCIPRGNVSADSINMANALLKSTYLNFAIKLVDLTNVPELSDYENMTYYSFDNTHLTEEGYKVVAKYVYDVIKDW